MGSLLRSRKQCFYCGQRSSQSIPRATRSWHCENCQAVNFLDEVSTKRQFQYGLELIELSEWTDYRSSARGGYLFTPIESALCETSIARFPRLKPLLQHLPQEPTNLYPYVVQI